MRDLVTDTEPYVGMYEEEAIAIARELNHRCRVMIRDGKHFAGTMDAGPDRVNFEVIEGRVVRAWVG